MKLSNPKNLFAFLEEEGFSAQKRFSQNFLIDGNILNKIVQTAAIHEGDVVLEIGPGPGALTQVLLENKATVIGIEIDRGFSEKLSRLQTPDHRLHVVAGDALKLNYKELLLPFLKSLQKAKVVANLPYAITTPILGKLFSFIDLFESLVVMVQKEMAERILATEGKGYSSLSVFVQTYATVSYGFTVEPSCFFPKPKVKSAVLLLTPQKRSLPFALEPFFLFVREAFHQRRKMLSSIFKDRIPKEKMQEALSALGLNPQARAEEVSPLQFTRLFSYLSSFLVKKEAE